MTALPMTSAQLSRRFAVCALVLGALYACITPPSEDELRQLLRALELGQGQLVPHADDVGAYHRAKASYARALERAHTLENDRKVRVEAAELGAVFSTLPDDQPSARVDASPFARSPFASVLLVPVARLSQALALGPHLQLYLSRALSLAAYVSLAAWAILVVEQLAWLWLAFALGPALLMRAASASSDGLIMGLAMLFFALLARAALVHARPLATRERVIALTAWAVLSLCGVEYTTFALALLALPRASSDEPLGRLPRLSLGALLLVGFLLSLWLTLGLGGPEPLLKRQLLEQGPWMLEHPFRILRGWARTLFKQADDYVIEVAAGGSSFTWLARFAGGLVGVLQLQLLFALSLGRLRAPTAMRLVRRRAARWLWLTCAAYVSSAFLLASLTCNTRASAPLLGLNGATFIPILPAALAALSATGKPLATRWLLKGRGRPLSALVALLNVICLLVLLGRSYAAPDPPWPY